MQFCSIMWHHLGCAMRKRVLGRMCTVEPQVSLHIQAGWSGPSLSTKWNIPCYRKYEWTAKTGWYLTHAQDDLNLCILHIFEGTFPPDMSHLIHWNNVKVPDSGLNIYRHGPNISVTVTVILFIQSKQNYEFNCFRLISKDKIWQNIENAQEMP